MQTLAHTDLVKSKENQCASLKLGLAERHEVGRTVSREVIAD